MRFIMMVKSDARSEAGELPSAEEFGKMDAFNGEMSKAGVMLAGEGLKASSHGARVEAVAGAKGKAASTRARVFDGPFAEARELVGGFWLVQTPTLADAIGWAKRVPFTEGEIEIRQLYELSDFPADPAEPERWREQERALREGTPAASAPADATVQPGPAGPARKPGTKRFMLLLKSDRVTESGALPTPEALAQMGGLMDELAKSGTLLGGEGLKPSARGAKVRFSSDKRTVLDGPFTEAKEMIAGYMIIQVPTKQEAIQVAERWLNLHIATSPAPLESSEIEIRALFEVEDFA